MYSIHLRRNYVQKDGSKLSEVGKIIQKTNLVLIHHSSFAQTGSRVTVIAMLRDHRTVKLAPAFSGGEEPPLIADE